jgi:hypothetical protein
MCQRIGIPPKETIGLGRNSVSSFILVPCPPEKITTGIFMSVYVILTQPGSFKQENA